MMYLREDLIIAILLYLPISFIGTWRWSFWIIRRVAALFYRPVDESWPSTLPRPTTSIVVPVYNEDPAVFAQALESYVNNGVDEIVAVIDRTDSKNILHISRLKQRCPTRIVLIVTPKPGKRPSLADGILASSGDIVALVDSDTIWDTGVLEYTLPYFQNPRIGGVTVRQKVYEPKTLSQVLFDMLLHVRYTEELPFMAATGHVVNTISGRTGIYRREALLNDQFDNMYHLTHEYYFKSRCISGDDKRLTHLIQEQGWEIAYQSRSIVYTPATPDLRTFLKQRLRWTRNSWRADTRAFYHGWILRHPALSIYNFDRFLQPFFMLFGVSIFLYSLIRADWRLAGFVLVWWTLTRLIRLLSYFYYHPHRIIFLPAYVLFSFWTAIIKVFAWFTITEQGWITRWDSSRLKSMRKLRLYHGIILTAGTIGYIFLSAVTWRGYVEERIAQAADEAQSTLFYSPVAITPPPPPTRQPAEPVTATLSGDYKQYIVQPGDTLTSISIQLGVPLDQLKVINLITNRNHIEIGQVIYYL